MTMFVKSTLRRLFFLPEMFYSDVLFATSHVFAGKGLLNGLRAVIFEDEIISILT
jgi:hypothetical protein